MENRAGSKRKLGRVVASRTLTEDGKPANRVEIVLGAPRRAGKDWECPFAIRGLGDGSVQTMTGADSLQALQLAVRAIRARLEETGRRFLWIPTAPTFGSGISIELPLGLGADFERRAKRFIEREVAAWIAHIEAEIPRRSRTQGSRPAKQTHGIAASSKLRTRKSKKNSSKT